MSVILIAWLVEHVNMMGGHQASSEMGPGWSID